MLNDTTIVRNKNRSIPMRVWMKVRKYISKKNREKMNAILHEKLKDIDFTIFSNNCLGGIFYHDAGLRFTSPTINMAFDGEDFIKFCENPNDFINKEFEFFKFEGHDYPLALVNGIEMRFVHYHTEQECIEKWHERFDRIVWDNIFIIATDVDGMYQKKWMERFDKLPYKNKIMFTAKKYPEYDWAVQIPAFKRKNNVHISTNFANIKGQRYYETCFDIADWIVENSN